MKVPRSRHPSVLALLVGAAVAVLLPASTAIALHSGPQAMAVTVQSPATLLARGAALEVSVAYSCPSGGSGFLDLTVTQRSGSEIVSGWDSRQVSCTGSTEVVRIVVTPRTGGRAFKKAPVVVEAELFSCGGAYVCGSVTDSREIDVTR